MDVGTRGYLNVFKRQAGKILFDEFDIKCGVGSRRVNNKIAWDSIDSSLRYKKLAVSIPLQLYGLQVSNGHGGTALSRKRLFFCR